MNQLEEFKALGLSDDILTVSYTHLDVYKRQGIASVTENNSPAGVRVKRRGKSPPRSWNYRPRRIAGRRKSCRVGAKKQQAYPFYTL